MLMTLGPRQWAVIAIVLLVVLPVITYIVFLQGIDSWYMREVVGPRLQREFGFRAGLRPVRVGNEQWQMFMITSVRKGGELEKAGFRAGDIPVLYYHGSESGFYYDLLAVRDGHDEQISVVQPGNLGREDWRSFRRIVRMPGRGTVTQPPPEGDRWTNSVGMTFARIPSGEFAMGSNAGDSHETPVHSVTISRSFYLATTEVTQAQWKSVMGINPSKFRGDDLPVEQVNWDDARRFIYKLNARERTTRYRLPTEAEWEYACRAGATGNGAMTDLSSSAWVAPESGNRTHPVGSRQPNAWGLFDMAGNVYEWCEDWRGGYPAGKAKDPQGPSCGWGRVARGGSWWKHANRAQCWFRDFYRPDYTADEIGFRVVAEAG